MSDLEKPSAFDIENAIQLQLVTSMRIYDVLMALLNDRDEGAAEALNALHESGKVLGALPWLDIDLDEDTQ